MVSWGEPDKDEAASGGGGECNILSVNSISVAPLDQGSFPDADAA